MAMTCRLQKVPTERLTREKAYLINLSVTGPRRQQTKRGWNHLRKDDKKAEVRWVVTGPISKAEKRHGNKQGKWEVTGRNCLGLQMSSVGKEVEHLLE